MNEERCPYCGAALQENAHFCLHCMRSLDEKMPAAAKRRRRWLPVAALAILAAVAAVALAVLLPRQTASGTSEHRTPICTFLQFQSAVRYMSDELELGELWEPRGFVQCGQKGEWTAYETALSIEQTQAQMWFYRDGEQIAIVFYDIPQRVNESYWLANCELLSVTRRNEDLFLVLSDRASYPATVLEAPFPAAVTDLYDRTAAYEQALSNGTQITTFYQRYDGACEGVHADYYEIKRVDGETITYDLVIWLAYD